MERGGGGPGGRGGRARGARVAVVAAAAPDRGRLLAAAGLAQKLQLLLQAPESEREKNIGTMYIAL